MLQPVVRRTWGPEGTRPSSTVGNATTASPESRRSRSRRSVAIWTCTSRVQEHNIRTPDVEVFVAEFLEHFPRGIILVMDRWSVHLSAADDLLQRFAHRIQIEWLPSDAPELNPDEQVWTRTKYMDLANFCPEHLATLRKRATFAGANKDKPVSLAFVL